ncbi:MAG TPA: DUF6352 family protein [Burkholderiales bacterium]|nr:DUF6352 family protein [Burkholderiales bacterium]
MATEFWRNSGFHLLERDAAGKLQVTDDFLRAYYLRPEIHPVEESGEGERRLHSALMEEPRRPLEEKDLAAIEDADARDNYRILLRFRQKLIDAGTVEGCYLSLFRVPIDVPPMFVDQLAHVILRNILDGCDDALRLRAAELFFRSQKATIQDGHVLLADLETVEMHASGDRYGSIGRLLVEAQGDVFPKDLDVLDRANAAIYWERESRHDTVISLTYGRAALDALCRVMEMWIAHFLELRVSIKPLRKIDEPRWAWHVGLDAESSAILNELWSGGEIEPGRMRNILAVFALQLDEPAAVRAAVRGRTVYLALSSEDGVVKMKPQNLLTNLPLNEA